MKRVEENQLIPLSFTSLFLYSVLRDDSPCSSAASSRLSSTLPPSDLSSADGRPLGCQPAAIPAATIPAMTVGAPNAELDRDRLDFGLARESGVADGDPKLSSRVGVCGACTELDRECEGLRDRCMIVSLGCWMANFRLFKRPPFIRLRKLSSSRTSASGSGYMFISSSDTVKPGTPWLRFFIKFGTIARMIQSGIRRMMIPTGMEIKPRTRAIAHKVPCMAGSEGGSAIWKAAPPTKMMRTCPPHMMMLIPMKNQFWLIPSKMLNLLSKRRLLRGHVSFTRN